MTPQVPGSICGLQAVNGDVRFALNALAEEGNPSVLSSPSMLVLSCLKRQSCPRDPH